MQVIQNLPFKENDVAKRVRMERLQKELLIPEKAELASLRLEALGEESIPILKTALKSPLLECRFYAAVALAYLVIQQDWKLYTKLQETSLPLEYLPMQLWLPVMMEKHLSIFKNYLMKIVLKRDTVHSAR